MRFIKMISATGRDSGGQQLAIPREVISAWGYPARLEVEFKNGILTLKPFRGRHERTNSTLGHLLDARKVRYRRAI